MTVRMVSLARATLEQILGRETMDAFFGEAPTLSPDIVFSAVPDENYFGDLDKPRKEKQMKTIKESSSKRLASLAALALKDPACISLDEIQELAGSVLTQFERGDSKKKKPAKKSKKGKKAKK